MTRGREKGTPKTGGRKAGTPNKVTSEVKDWLTALIDKNRKQVEKDLKELEPKDRLQMIEKLLGYVVPKQQATSARIDYECLSDAQLERVINELTIGLNDEDSID